MTLLYLMFWGVVVLREWGELRSDWRAAAVWSAAALSGLALWWLCQSSEWRLAEWLLGWQ